MSGAYYNENDSFAAAWLRELIKADLIAPGEVDERSIEEVKPDDLRGFTQCHFFAGIGVWSYALRNAGWADDLAVWTGSCPCQGFSASGQRGGFSDKRHLWPAWFRLISECRPVTVFGEQVASKDGLAWLDVVSADMEGAGYAIGATDICAAGVGAPHIRQRLYFVADAMRTGRQQICRGAFGDEAANGRAGRNGGESNSHHVTASGRKAIDMGQSESNGRYGWKNNGDAGRRQRASRQTGETGGVVNSERERRNGRQNLTEPGERGNGNITEGPSNEPLSNAGNADNERPQGQPEVTGAGGSELLVRAPGFTNGFWRDAEWIYCRDAKWRPVEPGTFPLVNGTPNTVGRLRGYGNAINAEVAKAFIEAYMSIG